MRVFVTGATGWVGSAVVQELLRHGHTVLGLCRSDASAATLLSLGGEVLRGTIFDVDILAKGVKECDGVIHTAFDYTDFEEGVRIDRAAVLAICQALEGSNKTFVDTGGLLNTAPGKFATEKARSFALGLGSGRAHTELEAMESTVWKGVRFIVVRLPPTVHGTGDHAIITLLGNTSVPNIF